MVVKRLAMSALLLAGAQFAGVASAQASAAIGLVPAALMASPLIAQPGCNAAPRPAFGSAAPQLPAVTSKASAILGGQVSQLELIARAQSGQAPAQIAQAGPATLPGAGMIPGAGGLCARFAPGLTLPIGAPAKFQSGLQRSPLGPDDYLGSKRLSVRRTVFDREWNRVKAEALPRKFTAALAGSVAGASGEAKLAAVNAWTNTHIRFADDPALYGQRDYWASARTTLKRGAGDCEDIAIAKLQLLAAMGVPRADMVLVIARDLARNADHAVLVVKLDGRHYLLDNATDRLLDASQPLDYRPILSFGANEKWLHGY